MHTHVRLTTLHHTRDYGPDERHGEGVIDVEFKRCLGVVVAMMGKNVKKRPHQVQAFPSDVGNLENRTYSLAHELCRSVDCVFIVLDEDRDLFCTRRF